MEQLPDNIDDIYINQIDSSNIFYQVHYDNGSNIINKIESLIVHDFIDNPDYYSSKNNSISYKSQDDDNNKIQSDEIHISINKSSIIENVENTNKIKITPTNSLSLSVPHNFFECFNDDTSINNAIVCDKLTTNYVFDNENIKDDIVPFEESIYDKTKTNNSRWSIIAMSALQVLGGGALF